MLTTLARIFMRRRVPIYFNCVRNPAGFLAYPLLPVVAIARAAPTGGHRSDSTEQYSTGCDTG